MAKTLSAEQFVLKALNVLCEETQSRNGRLGVRMSELQEAFDLYFHGDKGLAETIGLLVKDNEVIALRVIWKRSDGRSTLSEMQRLFSFPDFRFEERNPLLYLPKNLPKRFKARLTRSSALVEMIKKS